MLSLVGAGFLVKAVAIPGHGQAWVIVGAGFAVLLVCATLGVSTRREIRRTREELERGEPRGGPIGFDDFTFRDSRS